MVTSHLGALDSLQLRREVWAGGLDLVIRGGNSSKKSTETRVIRKPVIKVKKSRK